MFRKLLYLFSLLLIGFYGARVFAVELSELSPAMFNRFYSCQPYAETEYVRFYNKMYTVKKQLLGENNGKCSYKEIWTENKTNSSKIITCQFTSDQRISILGPTMAVPIDPTNVAYPMPTDRKMFYLYMNDPSVCKVSE